MQLRREHGTRSRARLHRRSASRISGRRAKLSEWMHGLISQVELNVVKVIAYYRKAKLEPEGRREERRSLCGLERAY